MERDEASVRLRSLLRRAGLDGVPGPALACVGVLCAALIVLALLHFWPGGGASDEFSTTGGGAQATVEESAAASYASLPESEELASSAQAEAAPIAVDVEGAVRSPGVYELPAGSRVADAVECAGGLSRSASRTSVNLAQKVEDGMQVYVATKKEMAGKAGASAGSGGISEGSALGMGTGQGAAGGSSASQKVNINTASAEELQKLSGIGPSLSQRIVDYREKNGSFKSVEELKEVSGIGDTRFEAIRDSVCI